MGLKSSIKLNLFFAFILIFIAIVHIVQFVTFRIIDESKMIKMKKQEQDSIRL